VVEVVVTVAAPGRYHYRVPSRLAGTARVGSRVLVRFGNTKVTGVVVRDHATPPPGIKLIDIGEVLDDEPSLSVELVELCLWIADYYESVPGEVFRGALPAGSGVKAKKVLVLTEAGRVAIEGALPARQRALLARLEDGPLAMANLPPPVKRGLAPLIESGLVVEMEAREAARARSSASAW